MITLFIFLYMQHVNFNVTELVGIITIKILEQILIIPSYSLRKIDYNSAYQCHVSILITYAKIFLSVPLNYKLSHSSS